MRWWYRAEAPRENESETLRVTPAAIEFRLRLGLSMNPAVDQIEETRWVLS
jgi:hypothetical protein